MKIVTAKVKPIAKYLLESHHVSGARAVALIGRKKRAG
jgi:hypothetical protein